MWIPSLLTLFLLSLVLPGMGSVLLWRRMTFYADALSHACFLGVALALSFKVHIILGMLMIAGLFGSIAFVASKQRMISLDTILSILSATFFSLSLILASIMKLSFSFEDVLFGDILTATGNTVILSMTLAILWVGFYFISSKPLIFASLSPELARIHYPRLITHEIGFMILLSFTIALAIPILGVILLPALMILPAASSRFLSRTPTQMIGWGVSLGILSAFAGFFASYHFDLPTSPVIILVSVMFLAMMYPLRKERYG